MIFKKMFSHLEHSVLEENDAEADKSEENENNNLNVKRHIDRDEEESDQDNDETGQDEDLAFVAENYGQKLLWPAPGSTSNQRQSESE